MESRQFIRSASAIIQRMADLRLAQLTNIKVEDNSQAIQKDISSAFAGLQNPTLPSAYKLRDAALDAGYSVDPRVLHNLAKAEQQIWQN